MITQETCCEIWECYREIMAGEKLLADLEAVAKENDERGKDKFEPRLSDGFGRLRKLQLGVPNGDNCHRLFDVSASLGVSMIRAHIAAKRAALVEANEKARAELGNATT